MTANELGLGACAMTTKFLDNRIFKFDFLLSWRFPRKAAFWDDFPLCPRRPPALKHANSIFIVVSPSLMNANDSNRGDIVLAIPR